MYLEYGFNLEKSGFNFVTLVKFLKFYPKVRLLVT